MDKPFCEQSRITRLCQECRVGSFAVATYIPEYGITPGGKILLDLREFRIPRGSPASGIPAKFISRNIAQTLSKNDFNKNFLFEKTRRENSLTP